jgi:formylglycine-generating enzyme
VSRGSRRRRAVARVDATGQSARLAIALAVTLALAACNPAGRASGAAADGTAGGPPWGALLAEPEPRPGMAFVPPGVHIAGTPEGRLPRVADEEMAGEQVVMHGFYVDVFPYPNEAGAIPTTNIDHAEARKLCEDQGKRLCTELELERACKGSDNLTFEYGDAYRALPCGTGVARSMIPNGFNTDCRSAFGVHDLHGSVWSWTASQWRRGARASNLIAARGGNGTAGELVGRCANGRGVARDSRRDDVGVRCCAGEANTFEVVLDVTRGEPLKWQPLEEHRGAALEKLLPEAVTAPLIGRRPEDQFKMERLWVWHPLGNEELLVGGGCAHPGEVSRCGVVIARMRFETPVTLAFVSSDGWQPTLSEAESPRELFLHGGDRAGAFRRRVSYAWGRIAIGVKERRKQRKGQREASY